jgi:hypothetical protein
MFSKFEQPYEPVIQDDETPEVQTPKKNPRLKARSLIYIFAGFALVLAVFTIVSVFSVRHSHHPFWSSCGTSSDSARHRGCSFDLISFAWQTPECYDSSLVSEFSNWDTWAFYTERHGNITVPQEEALRGEQSLWVSWHYHMVHCTFMWRQMHRAYENGWIDAHLHAYNHTLHCQKMLLMEGIDDEDVFTKATVIYPACERVGSSTRNSWWDSVYSR